LLVCFQEKLRAKLASNYHYCFGLGVLSSLKLVDEANEYLALILLHGSADMIREDPLSRLLLLLHDNYHA